MFSRASRSFARLLCLVLRFLFVASLPCPLLHFAAVSVLGLCLHVFTLGLSFQLSLSGLACRALALCFPSLRLALGLPAWPSAHFACL